jgi:hypothetical protein
MAKGEDIPKTSPAEIEKLIEQIRETNLEPDTKEKVERLLRIGNEISPSEMRIKDSNSCRHALVPKENL